jgi:type VI secretion system protein ImpH
MQLEKINLKLNNSVSRYILPQAIRVTIIYLKMFYPDENKETLYKRIIFKANPSLSFQKSEIKEIKFIEFERNVKVEITLNFLGIFGSSSPLPSHYSELVLQSLDMDKVLYDFLNLFNHHLQKFVYSIWEKHRYYIQFKKDLSDKFSKYILSFLGLYFNIIENNSSLDFSKLLPYVGILSMRYKSAGTLKSILRHYLSHENIEIIQCISDKYKIPTWQYSSLGKENISLGKDFLIGESVISKNGKFRILLRDVSSDDLIKYSILGKKMKELNELISFSLKEPLKYEVCLEIKKEKKTQFKLNQQNRGFLGINCWIGESSEDEQILMIQKGK